MVNVRLQSEEQIKDFTVTIELPDGSETAVRQLAYTTWHAMDKVYYQYCNEQSDRSKYSAKLTLHVAK